MHNFSGIRKLWMDLPEMHSAGKPLDVRISARCWALREHTHTENWNKTRPNNTCQSLGHSLQPGTAFWYFQYFTVHSSGCISELSLAECSETSQVPEFYPPWLDITSTALKQALSRCYCKSITCCANLRRLRLGWKESCWTTPAGAGFFPQRFYVGGDGNSQFCSTASALSRKPKQQIRGCHKNMHRVL